MDVCNYAIVDTSRVLVVTGELHRSKRPASFRCPSRYAVSLEVSGSPVSPLRFCSIDSLLSSLFTGELGTRASA